MVIEDDKVPGNALNASGFAGFLVEHLGTLLPGEPSETARLAGHA